jgi:hypothetical protein
MLDYELRRQKFLKKTIDQDEIEITRMPFCQEIDELKRNMAEILKEINYTQSELWHLFSDDY